MGLDPEVLSMVEIQLLDDARRNSMEQNVYSNVPLGTLMEIPWNHWRSPSAYRDFNPSNRSQTGRFGPQMGQIWTIMGVVLEAKSLATAHQQGPYEVGQTIIIPATIVPSSIYTFARARGPVWNGFTVTLLDMLK